MYLSKVGVHTPDVQAVARDGDPEEITHEEVSSLVAHAALPVVRKDLCRRRQTGAHCRMW